MARLIPVLEYKPVDVSTGAGEPGLTITPAQAEEVISLAEHFGCVRPIEWFSYQGRDKLRAGCWVGSLRVGDAQIEVSPKIETGGAQDARVDLISMLIGAGELDIELREVSQLAGSPRLIDALALWYSTRLARECSRGLLRDYRERRDDIPLVRGRLDVGRQWMNQAMRRPLAACVFDEYVEDSELNRILKAGLAAALRSDVTSVEARRSMRSTLTLLEGVADQPITYSRASAYKPARREQRFKALLSLACLFISGSYTDVRSKGSADKQGMGLMWNMWELFQEYAFRALVGENDADKKLKLPSNLQAQAQFRGPHLISNGQKDLFMMMPDIVIMRDGIPVMICDTKWKLAEKSKKAPKAKKGKSMDKDEVTALSPGGKLGISQSDLYQMFAYSRYFQARYGLKSPVPIAMIYPVPAGKETKECPKGPEGTDFLPQLKHLAVWKFRAEGAESPVYVKQFPVPVSPKSEG